MKSRHFFVLVLITSVAGCRLQFLASPGGSIAEPSLGYSCKSECALEPDVGYRAEFRATPDSYYKFAGWAGTACNGRKPETRLGTCKVVVNESIKALDIDLTLNAYFTRKLSNNFQRDNDLFKISNFGFGSFYTEEKMPVTCYNNMCGEEGEVSFIEPNSYGIGDFNADGWEDLVIQVLLNPRARREMNPGPVIFLNDRNGGFYRSDAIFVNGRGEDMHFGNRIGVADFNGDNKDDIVIGAMGFRSGEPGNSDEYTPERIPLYLSTEEGKLRDASHQIEGQENDGLIPSWRFGHDLAVGDIDGDGDQDFFQGNHLFINDGEGNFSLGRLPAGCCGHTLITASLIDDFDGDGIGDLWVGFRDQGSPSWLYLSDGSAGMAQRARTVNPRGFYGTNTNHNHAASKDIDGDGDVDIVIGQTRLAPYYYGRALQILINDGHGNFTDESHQRINQEDIASDIVGLGSWGEGFVRLIDMNGDGHIDIFDQNAAQGGYDNGVDIWINNGQARFIRVPQSQFPWVEPRDLMVEGGSNYENDRLQDGVPINLDRKNGIDIVTYVHTSKMSGRNFSEATLYTLTSKQKLRASDF